MTLKLHSVPIIPYGSLLELFYCDTVFLNGDNEQYKNQQLGHAGQDNTEKADRKRFWMPNIQQDVRQSVNACSTCQQLKAVRATPRAPLQPIETGYPNRDWALTSWDPPLKPERGTGTS